jgi:hypothetical protein
MACIDSMEFAEREEAYLDLNLAKSPAGLCLSNCNDRLVDLTIEILSLLAQLT